MAGKATRKPRIRVPEEFEPRPDTLPTFPFDATDVPPARLVRFAYCAFGSNLNRLQMAFRCPRSEVLCAGVLHDFRLVFRNVADVEFSPGRNTPVGLYRVTRQCVEALDRYEGFPRKYERRFVLVTTDAGPLWCFVYVMREQHIDTPSPGYLATIRRGYQDFKLPLLTLREAHEHALRVKYGSRAVDSYRTPAPRIPRGVARG